jgi:VanZ family protein
VLAIAVLGVLAVIFVAGLWPFNPFPANHLTWIKEGNGLEFAGEAILVSRGPFDFSGPDWSSITLELWLRPGVNATDTLTVFAIYTPENPGQFRMMQYRNLLLVRWGRKGEGAPSDIAIGETLFANAPVFVTIASGPNGTWVYSNGKPARQFPRCVLSGRDLSGQFIIGTSPINSRTWPGELRGLAVYGAELSPAEVLDHYEKWTSGRQAELIRGSAPTTLFDFHERAGKTIHDLAGNTPDLFIPRHYFVPHKPVLQAPWDEYRSSRASTASTTADVALNIAGFVPLGFLFSAFLWSTTRSKRPVSTAILVGALISFTIELLQAYIPDRSSGMTDVLTNTFGTALGAVPCGFEKVRAVLAKLGLARRN